MPRLLLRRPRVVSPSAEAIWLMHLRGVPNHVWVSSSSSKAIRSRVSHHTKVQQRALHNESDENSWPKPRSSARRVAPHSYRALVWRTPIHLPQRISVDTLAN